MRSLEPEKRFGHQLKLVWNPKSYGLRLKLIWNPKSALATDPNWFGTRKAMAIDSSALERSLEPEKRFGHRLKLTWNPKNVMATNSN